MKFRYFNLSTIKKDYIEQIEQFADDYMFCFPFIKKSHKLNITLTNGLDVLLIYADKVYAGDAETYLFWNDLSIEDLDNIIEQVFEPAMLQYEIREKGTLN